MKNGGTSNEWKIFVNSYTPPCLSNFSGSSGPDLQSGWLTEDTIVILFVFVYFMTDSFYL